MVIRFKPLFVLVVILLSSCNSKSVSDGRDSLVVTIEPLRYVVEQISGDDFNITVMVPPGASPEIYEPIPEAMRAIATSKAYISIGLLECEHQINSSLSDDISKLKLYRNIEGIEIEYQHGDHSHTGMDPHFWCSVKEMRTMASDVASLLCEINSDSTSKYQTGYSSFMAKLDTLDQYIDSKIEAKSGSRFITYHPDLGYFARDYNLTQLSIEVDGKEPTISSMKYLSDVISEDGIRYIFCQRQHSSDAAEVIAKQCGCEVISYDAISGDWYDNMISITDMVSKAL